MRKYYQLFTLLVSSLTVLSPSMSVQAAPSEFLIQSNGQSTYLNFDAIPRLDAAVLSVLQKQNIDPQRVDWLQSTLFDLSSPYRYREVVMDTLFDQLNLANGSDKARWAQFIKQLQVWRYGKRIFLPLDPDATVLDKEKNPKLKGKWLLQLSFSSDPVWVLGDVDKPGKYPWKLRQDAKEYTEDAHSQQPFSDEVYVIQSDGVVEKHSIAYWQSSYQEISPGSIIYVPFDTVKSTFHPEYTIDNPNDMVVELLRNRIR